MPKKLTPSEIQEINRQIAAGIYKHIEPEDDAEPVKKPASRGRPKKQPEVDTDE